MLVSVTNFFSQRVMVGGRVGNWELTKSVMKVDSLVFVVLVPVLTSYK